MKTFKVLLLAIVAVFVFTKANAQVKLPPPPPRPPLPHISLHLKRPPAPPRRKRPAVVLPKRSRRHRIGFIIVFNNTINRVTNVNSLATLTNAGTTANYEHGQFVMS